jgi:hypothetical protein
LGKGRARQGKATGEGRGFADKHNINNNGTETNDPMHNRTRGEQQQLEAWAKLNAG